MKVLVATNNPAKVERYRMLLRGRDFELTTPSEEGIECVDVAETADSLRENALLKARAYVGKTALPILANDTGVWVEGEGLVHAPKRVALGDKDEKDMSKEETADAMRTFWKGIAQKYGGEVNAGFPEAFALILPDGSEKVVEINREITLTNQEFGTPHMSFPIRSLYISKVTGKPAVNHTQEEEDAELTPVREGLLSLLS